MLHLTKIQIAAIAVTSVLASYVAAGSLASQNTSLEPQNLTLEQALAEMQSADPIYMQIQVREGQTIEGESTDAGFERWIIADSFQHGVFRSLPSTPGGESGPPVFQPIIITKELDKSSPKLFQACARGDHFDKVEIVFVKATKAGGKPVRYLEITLTNAMVSSYSTSGQAGGIPSDSISFTYTKIEWKYTQTDKKGNEVAKVEATWDLVEGHE